MRPGILELSQSGAVHFRVMADAMTIAASGLQAAGRALSVAAVNIANDATVGPVSAEPPDPAQTAQTANRPVLASAAPMLDLASQLVSQMEAANAFRANLAVYRTASRMYRALLKL